MKIPLSVIILTYNEEIHLERLMKNIADWTDEIFIVDSYSTDKTLDIARRYGAKIVQHPFENQAKQFNWALDNLPIKNDWILRLDADESLTEELKNEISETLINADKKLINADNISINQRPKNQPQSVKAINGFYLKRRVYFMGRWIRHGGYYPVWFLRLFRKGKARSEERGMDEHLVLLEGKAGKLKNDFIDDNRKDLSWWIDKHNKYASREANAILETSDVLNIGVNIGTSDVQRLGDRPMKKRWLKKKIYYKLPLFCRAFLYFLYRYFFQLGFLDGKEGLIFHFLQGFWYRFLIDAKIYELKKKR